MMENHDIEWDESIELKSQYRVYSEPMPQTDPDACTTAAQLCLHHDYDPELAEATLTMMKTGLGKPSTGLNIDTDWIYGDIDWDSVDLDG